VNEGLHGELITLRNAIPRELLELFEVDDTGIEKGLKVVPALFGAIVLEVFVGLRFLDLFLSVEDIGDVKFLLYFAAVLLPALLWPYFLKSLKMDIK
jgi:hypothetical protein